MWERYPPTPPAFARCATAGEGCRAVALAKAGFMHRPERLRLGKPFRTRSSISPDESGLSAGGLRVQLPSGPPSARSAGATCLAWDQVTAGASPVALTISMLPWPNISGIRLLSGSMQVRILPAAPLPGGVKVARRPVKPLVLVRFQVWQPICTDGWQRSNAPVPKTE